MAGAETYNWGIWRCSTMLRAHRTAAANGANAGALASARNACCAMVPKLPKTHANAAAVAAREKMQRWSQKGRGNGGELEAATSDVGLGANRMQWRLRQNINGLCARRLMAERSEYQWPKGQNTNGRKVRILMTEGSEY